MRAEKTKGEGEGKKMGSVLLGVIAAVCAFQWLLCRVGTRALVKHLKDKGYDPPSDEELHTCTLYVWKKLLHIK